MIMKENDVIVEKRNNIRTLHYQKFSQNYINDRKIFTFVVIS